jgi:hypothetical protein
MLLVLEHSGETQRNLCGWDWIPSNQLTLYGMGTNIAMFPRRHNGDR